MLCMHVHVDVDVDVCETNRWERICEYASLRWCFVCPVMCGRIFQIRVQNVQSEHICHIISLQLWKKEKHKRNHPRMLEFILLLFLLILFLLFYCFCYRFQNYYVTVVNVAAERWDFTSLFFNFYYIISEAYLLLSYFSCMRSFFFFFFFFLKSNHFDDYHLAISMCRTAPYSQCV